MIIKIENLKKYPQHIEKVVDWLYSEWGNKNRNFWEAWVKSSLFDCDIPETFVLLIDEKAVGTYSLWRCDLQSRQDLFPWFGGLFVEKAYRGKKYCGDKLGEIMQRHAFDELKRLGYKDAYLFTERDPQYYLRNGWQYIGKAPDERDSLVSLCSKKL